MYPLHHSRMPCVADRLLLGVRVGEVNHKISKERTHAQQRIAVQAMDRFAVGQSSKPSTSNQSDHS